MQEPTIIHSRLLSGHPGIRFAVSTRLGGVSPQPLGMNLSFRVGDDALSVTENRRLFLGLLGCSVDAVALPLQCHSDRIQMVNLPGEYDSTDGLITKCVGLSTVVTIADCLAVMLYDPVRRATAAVHAGWRGTALSIVTKAVSLLKQEFGSHESDLIAFLSPSAGVCCYEVGADVAGRFPARCVQERGGRLFLDLKTANADQLLQCGIAGSNLEVSEHCTICNEALFHSYRRDGGKSGRMMAAICMVDERDR